MIRSGEEAETDLQSLCQFIYEQLNSSLLLKIEIFIFFLKICKLSISNFEEYIQKSQVLIDSTDLIGYLNVFDF